MGKTKLLSLVTAVCVCMGFCGCAEKTADTIRPDSREVTGNFTVTCMKVGKADAFILSTENTTMVIDTGESTDGKKIVNLLEEQGKSTIDYLLITHFDQDHVGGASKLIKNVEVKNVIQPDYEKSGKEYDKYVEAMNEQGITPVTLDDEMTLTLDDVTVNLYPAEKDDYGKDEENDFSIVASIVHGENSFLFMGDAEEARQQEILNMADDIQHTFLKFPYHGHYLSTTDELLDRVSPEYVVVTCSDSEPADEELLKALSDRNIETFLTVDGTKTFLSDGKTLTIS